LKSGDSHFPLGNYQKAAEEFVRYACKMPSGLNDHPLNDTHPKGNSLIDSQKKRNKLVLLGSYWNWGNSDKSGVGSINAARFPRGPRGMTRNIKVQEGTPILCCPFLSIISAEEFPHRFKKRGPSQPIMDEARKIIDEAMGKVTVRKNNGAEKKFTVRQMERISVRDGRKKSIRVSPGVWPSWRRGGTVHGCWDGYFLIFKGLQKGSYKLVIETSAKMFDARKKGEDKFFTEVTYKMIVE
jgi:hypothetical protein